MSCDLEGILVVSLEQAVAAPYLSGKLAEAGARVIKVERREGDFARHYDHLVHGESAYFVWLNRGKESIALDLREPGDKMVMQKIIDEADVFIQNLAPGAIDRLGFGAGRMRARRPSLITVSISGYGDEGPYRNRKAYDLLVQAESGLSAITGNTHGSARVGVSVCDIACGMTAHQAVLQALYARQKSGEGRHISVSLFHSLADWMNVPYMQYNYGGVSPDRAGLSHPTIAPYGAYAGGDKRHVLFSIQNEREWLNFCEHVLNDVGVAKDVRFMNNSSRVANRGDLDAIINDAISRYNREELISKLDLAGIANGRVSSMEDIAHHPQNRFVDADTPTGPVRLFAPGATVNGESPRFGRVPAIDEHGSAIRAEFSGEKAIIMT
ncbi:CaiB/BaiF CoA transferase family protein [Rhizobium giardinii]|uniref:Crotonobetainyl-CoA:carnitine CoA-transferase CaiB-like acyl-CoA transferase n=1 Tax=Rhizobium giardinii TaxID=56731 RepID=A0A7W8UCE3_9HYPH|nr:CaiB/BaiF CoA-transferase family protein [Rhizobium giardinii]MBB5536184.1 crotonobetainyl-CoA:carnitine CoA-transferase CaiB-like acyl-CoA transferase [Rhizobium giardinii]